MIKKFFIILLCFSFLIIGMPFINVNADTTIEIGDYIELGKYNNQPILWRCVDLDENGPLMLSDKIIAIKAFDAAGNHDGNANSDRKEYGSNSWEKSNIRSWLNSSEGSGKVKWECGNLPDSENVFDGSNPYAYENGFLSNENFDANELDFIKSVVQKTILNLLDVRADNDGSVLYNYNYKIENILENYDKSFSKSVTDKMFLLDVKQLYQIYQNKNILGNEYYIGTLSRSSVGQLGDQSSDLSPSLKWNYLLRTPYSGEEDPSKILFLNEEGSIGVATAYNGKGAGIRPTFYLNTENIEFNFGDGSEANPYNNRYDTTKTTAVTTKPSPSKNMDINVGVSIGDYVKFGKYNNEDIIWRCIDIDENGPLMFSDKILSIKSFDSKGLHPSDSFKKRLTYGSNFWETSNIRSWLNSTANEGEVIWLCNNPPYEESVYNGFNSYSSEKGFLSTSNFTDNEQLLIKEVNQKSILNFIDIDTKDGGTQEFVIGSSINDIISNYEESYYRYLNDKMFLLDVKQFSKIIKNKNILGEKYYFAYPTKKAIEFNEDSGKFDDSHTYSYWLRTPCTEYNFPELINIIGYDGEIYGANVSDYEVGVKPAFYINTQNINEKSGNGSIDSPYVFTKRVDNNLAIIPIVTPTDNKSNVTPTKIQIDNSNNIPTKTVENRNYPPPPEGLKKAEIKLSIDKPYMDVNGESVEIDIGKNTSPIIENGRTFLPIRAVIEAIGGSVEWEGSTQKITLTVDDKKLEMWIGNSRMSANGVSKEIDPGRGTVPIIVNGRTMIPIRAVVEEIDGEIQWEAETNSVIVRY